MNKLLLIGMVMVLLVVTGCSEEEGESYEIVGNSVMVNDSNVYMLITPHTIKHSDWVELEFESKLFSGDIDVAFGFDTDAVRPTRVQRWNPHEEDTTHTYTCDYDFSYNATHFWCFNEEVNGTTQIFDHDYDGGNIPTQTAWWNTTETVDWSDFSGAFNSVEFDFDDKDTWHYIAGQHVNAEQEYKIRYFLEVEAGGSPTQYKYDVALKPSSESIEQAINNDHFYFIDPWADTPTLNTNIIAYYSFEDVGGFNYTDLTGNGNNLSAYVPADIANATGKIGSAFTYPSNPTYLTGWLYQEKRINLGNDFTVITWMNNTETQTTYFLGNETDGAFDGFGLGCINSGVETNNRLIMNANTGESWITEKGFCDEDDGSGNAEYIFIAVTYNTTTATAYFGNASGLHNETNSTLTWNIDPITFGIGNSNVGSWNLGGALDETAMWNRSLSGAEITALWNNGDGLEYTSSATQHINIIDLDLSPSSANVSIGSINCSANVTTLSGLNYNASMNWSNSSYSEVTEFKDKVNGTSISANITIDFVANDVWNCSIFASERDNVSINDTDSVAITISDTAPTVPNFFYPANNSVIIGNSLNLNCSNSTDLEDQTIYYEIYGNQTGSNYDLLSNNTGGNYTWGGLTTGLTYDWQCRAWAGNYQTSDFTGNNSFSVFNLTNCTSETGEFNFYMKDETNSTALTSTFEATFEVTIGDFGGNYTFDLAGYNNYSICLEEGSMWINESMIEYSAESFDPRQYYMFNTNITNGSQTNISLYLLEIILGTGTTFLVEDQSGNPLEGYYIYIDRYDVGTNTYRTVAMVKTDENGEDYVYLRHNDAWYRFTVYYEGEMQFRSERKKISSTTQTIEIGEDTWSYYQDQFEDVLYDLSFDNTTKKYTTIFSTTSGVARNVCMRVTEHRSGGYLYEEFDQCVSSASGSLSHTISNNASSYFAEAYVSINPQHALVSLWYDPDASFIWGTFGVILVIILIAGMVMIGASVGEMGVGISLILVPVILISARVMGLITIGQGAIMAVGTLVAFIIVKMKGFAR